MPTKLKKILTSAFAVVLSLSLVTVSVAWFKGYNSQFFLNFTTGGNAKLPDIEVWKYLTAEEAMLLNEENETNTYTEGWKKELNDDAPSKNSDGTSFTIARSPETQNGGTFEFVNPLLHFGRVDNLISLQPDNITYIRLTITTAVSGCEALRVSLDYSTPAPTVEQLYADTTLYGEEITAGSAVNNIIEIQKDTLKTLVNYPLLSGSTEGLADISSEYCQFLQISVAVTADASLTPDKAGFANLVFDNYDNDDTTEFDPIGGDDINIDLREALGVDDEATPPATYYVYLKIAPKLEFFVLQENLLDQFVPSYMFFDTKLEFELH